MKKLLIACCAALALAACAPAIPSAPTAPIVSGQGSTIDERAMIGLYTTYNVVSDAYLVAVRRNLLPDGPKDQARAALIRSYDALLLARRAYDAGNAGSFAAQVSLFTTAIAEARGLLPAQ